MKKAKLIKRVIGTKFTVGYYHWKENGKINGKMRSKLVVDGRQVSEPENVSMPHRELKWEILAKRSRLLIAGAIVGS